MDSLFQQLVSRLLESFSSKFTYWAEQANRNTPQQWTPAIDPSTNEIVAYGREDIDVDGEEMDEIDTVDSVYYHTAGLATDHPQFLYRVMYRTPEGNTRLIAQSIASADPGDLSLVKPYKGNPLYDLGILHGNDGEDNPNVANHRFYGKVDKIGELLNQEPEDAEGEEWKNE